VNNELVDHGPDEPHLSASASAVSFQADIRPLMREIDRDEMLYIFDLWDAEAVAGDAANILERLEDGTMPCDAPWDRREIDLFKRWMESGCPPLSPRRG
jgi:hypothetical protein